MGECGEERVGKRSHQERERQQSGPLFSRELIMLSESNMNSPSYQSPDI